MSFFLIDIAHSMAELGVRGSETQINTHTHTHTIY
jgi:hypothetical protein